MKVDIKLIKPHVNQQKIIDSKAKFVIVMAGRRFGKSVIALNNCIKELLQGHRVAYVVPTIAPLGREFYAEILKTIPSVLIKTENKTELYIELVTGGNIRFYSGESLKNFRGNKYHYIVIDECTIIRDLSFEFNESILPTLIDYNGRLLAISTPKGKEIFYSWFMKGKNNEDGFESFHFTTYDNPTLTNEQIDTLLKPLSQSQVRQEILAIPAENQDNPFGSENINKNIIQELSNQPTVIYGVDFGKIHDYTVITGLDKNYSTTFYSRFREPYELTKQRILELPKGIPIYCDSTGVGESVVESLQLSSSDVYGFKFTQESKPKIIYELIKKVQNGDIKYNQQTADEMHTFEYSYNSNGKILFNAVAGFFDDSIASIAIACYHLKEVINGSNFKLYIR